MNNWALITSWMRIRLSHRGLHFGWKKKVSYLELCLTFGTVPNIAVQLFNILNIRKSNTSSSLHNYYTEHVKNFPQSVWHKSDKWKCTWNSNRIFGIPNKFLSAGPHLTNFCLTYPANTQRGYNVAATSRCCSYVVTTFMWRCVFAGYCLLCLVVIMSLIKEKKSTIFIFYWQPTGKIIWYCRKMSTLC